MLVPPIYVNTTAPTPPRYGLLDAADQVIPEDRVFGGGIEFQPACRLNASVNLGDCLDPEGFDFDDPAADGRPVVSVAPIHVHAGFVCRTVGFTVDDWEREAALALALSAPMVLETTLWTPAPDPDPGSPQRALRLMGPDTVVLAAAPVGLVAGIRLAEDYLAGNYGGTGVIHAPAGVSADIAAAQQVRWESGGKPATTRGTRWSWGHYPYTDPDGAAAETGTAWLVVTGAVTLRQSPITRVGDYAELVDRATNDVYSVATRSYVVAWECVTAAVPITLTS